MPNDHYHHHNGNFLPPCILGEDCQQFDTSQTHFCCSRCRICKPHEEFPDYKAPRRGLHQKHCMPCAEADEKAKAKNLKRKKSSRKGRGRGGSRGGAAGAAAATAMA